MLQVEIPNMLTMSHTRATVDHSHSQAQALHQPLAKLDGLTLIDQQKVLFMEESTSWKLFKKRNLF